MNTSAAPIRPLMSGWPVQGPSSIQGPPPMVRPLLNPTDPNAGAPNASGAQATQKDAGTGEVWVETKAKDDKVYYYNAKTRETTWTKPEGDNIKIMSQSQVEILAKTAKNAINPSINSAPIDQLKPGINPMGVMPPFMPGGAPPFGMPPPGAWPPNPGPWPNAGMPPWRMPMIGQPVPPKQYPNEPLIMSKIDKKILEAASDWTEHRAPDGRSYFYNSKKSESVWEKPSALKELDLAKAAVAQALSVSNKENPHLMKPESNKNEPITTNGLVGKGQELQAKKSGPGTNAAGHEIVSGMKDQKQDKSKPISSTPVAGTPWCIVWTGDRRVFYYNPSTRTSVWDRPDELIGRNEVDKLVSTPPSAVLENNVGNSQKGPLQQQQQQPRSVNSMQNVAKRGRDSESSDSESESKRNRSDIGNIAQGDKNRTATNSLSNAVDIEAQAARDRATIPLDDRIKAFRDMLIEKDVSAFSTWEKELHKIVFDSRYLLLTSRERKQVFDRYVKDRAEEERKEKRNKIKLRRDAFRRLIQEANVNGKSSFSEFAHKYGKDERFKNIEKMREREMLFNDFVGLLRRKEKEEKLLRREAARKEFIAMLKECTEIDRHSHWADIKKKLENDPRYKAAESSSLRESWFKDYCKQLKEEKRKEKGRTHEPRKERSTKCEENKQDENWDQDQTETSHDDSRLVSSTIAGDGGNLSVSDVVDTDLNDQDRNAVTTLPTDYEIEEGEDVSSEKEVDEAEREKLARTEASLREREKQVQRTLATHLRDRDKEREQHKQVEAVEQFNALLVDLVRNADVTWKEVKKSIKKDSRWEIAAVLNRDDRDRLFNEHIDQLYQKKKEKFRELLDETPEVAMNYSWKEIKKIIKDDPRCIKFGSSEKCEREFRDYVRDRLQQMKIDFRELLAETKLITHRSLEMMEKSETYLSEIEEVLKNDQRYLKMDHIPHERRQILINYVDDLDKKGPPPPPTASEKNRRLK